MKNFRELSYENIKTGMLFRSEMHHNLKKSDINTLKKNNVKVVVDLRMPEEYEKEKDTEISGIKYVHIPLITMEYIKTNMMEEAKRIQANPSQDFIYRLFVRIDLKEAWTKIFDLLLEEDGILFHCTTGKDRTGTVVMAILESLGVGKDTIYNDYLLTNKNPIMPFKYKVRAFFFNKKKKAMFLENFCVRKELLDTAYDEINKEYGSIDKFLLDACGLTQEKRDLLKQKYLK